MERAACLLSRLKSARRILGDRDFVEAAWPAAVGKRLAQRARVLRLDERRLTVAVEDILWQRNFQGLSGHILSNLKELLGAASPDSIEFVIGAPRILPKREEPAPAAARLIPVKRARA